MDPVCASLDNSFECARAIETQQLRAHQGIAWRGGDTLFLRLDNGRIAEVLDEGSEAHAPVGTESASYSFVERLSSLPYYLVHAQYAEGNGYTLVHAGTGWRRSIEGRPQPSPDGRWILIAEDGYFNDMGVFLYAVLQDSIAPAWHRRPEGWVPGRAVWQSSRSAVVERLQDVADPSVRPRVVGSLVLLHDASGWRAVAR